MFWLPIVANTLFQAPAHRLYWRLKKISYRACLLFYYLFGDKKQLLRALLTCTFIRLLLNFFDLCSCNFKIEENIHIKAVTFLMFLEVLKEEFFCFPVTDWQRFVRNYCLYWMLNMNENLNMALLIQKQLPGGVW